MGLIIVDRYEITTAKRIRSPRVGSKRPWDSVIRNVGRVIRDDEQLPRYSLPFSVDPQVSHEPRVAQSLLEACSRRTPPDLATNDPFESSSCHFARLATQDVYLCNSDSSLIFKLFILRDACKVDFSVSSLTGIHPWRHLCKVSY